MPSRIVSHDLVDREARRFSTLPHATRMADNLAKLHALGHSCAHSIAQLFQRFGY